jgi:hypothetical protein
VLSDLCLSVVECDGHETGQGSQKWGARNDWDDECSNSFFHHE